MQFIGIIGVVASYECLVQAVLQLKKTNIDSMKTEIEINKKTLSAFDEAIKEERDPTVKAEHEKARNEFYTKQANVTIARNRKITLKQAEARLNKELMAYDSCEKSSLIHQAKRLINQPL